VIKSLLVIATALLLVIGPSSAASARRSDSYRSGGQHGTTRRGVTLRVTGRSIFLQRISFRERCRSGGRSFRDEFTFRAGQGNTVTGGLDRRGRFVVRYRSVSGTLSIRGAVHGGHATVHGSERNTFIPTGATAAYDCRGQSTFDARRR
jgi:hypothetical protein